MNRMTFHILGIITPTDFHIFQRCWNHQLNKFMIVRYIYHKAQLCRGRKPSFDRLTSMIFRIYKHPIKKIWLYIGLLYFISSQQAFFCSQVAEQQLRSEAWNWLRSPPYHKKWEFQKRMTRGKWNIKKTMTNIFFSMCSNRNT